MIHRAGFRIALAASLLVAGGALSARAAVLESFNDFSNINGLTTVGQTDVIATSDGNVLRLVPSSFNQSGAAYSNAAVSLGSNATFSTTFDFRMTNPGGTDPADGFTFILASSPGGLGSAGGGMGYGGVDHSVAITFDTFNNDTTGIDDGNSSNHIGILKNGNLNVVASNNPYNVNPCEFTSPHDGILGFPDNHNGGAGSPGCMSNGDKWSVSINYNGSQLNVKVQDGSLGVWAAYTDYNIDIADLIGSTSAYVGFTAATGAGWQNVDILNWHFADDTHFDTPPSAVPEPISLSVIGFGLAGLVAARRRRTA